MWWRHYRRVVGMVKSPVEGHDIVLLKLEQPLVFSGESFLFQPIGEELALPVDQSEGWIQQTCFTLNFPAKTTVKCLDSRHCPAPAKKYKKNTISF